VVLVTKALFLSEPCLNEIHTAMTSKCAIELLIYEHLPPAQEQWPLNQFAKTEAAKSKIEAVRAHLLRLNVSPSPPDTAFTDPNNALMMVFARISNHLDGASPGGGGSSGGGAAGTLQMVLVNDDMLFVSRKCIAAIMFISPILHAFRRKSLSV
jgi:hypothetical protein